MLLKALKFITPIHRQIECSQCDHQLFTGIGIFLKSSRDKSNMKKNITTGETTPATAFIFTFTSFIFFIFFTFFILFTFFTFFIFFRVKESFSVLPCPIVSWQVLERFDLVPLSQKRTPHSHTTPHSHKREHHTLTKENTTLSQKRTPHSHTTLSQKKTTQHSKRSKKTQDNHYILLYTRSSSKEEIGVWKAFKWPLSMWKHAEQIFIQNPSFCGNF